MCAIKAPSDGLHFNHYSLPVLEHEHEVEKDCQPRGHVTALKLNNRALLKICCHKNRSVQCRGWKSNKKLVSWRNARRQEACKPSEIMHNLQVICAIKVSNDKTAHLCKRLKMLGIFLMAHCKKTWNIWPTWKWFYFRIYQANDVYLPKIHWKNCQSSVLRYESLVPWEHVHCFSQIQMSTQLRAERRKILLVLHWIGHYDAMEFQINGNIYWRRAAIIRAPGNQLLLLLFLFNLSKVKKKWTWMHFRHSGLCGPMPLLWHFGEQVRECRTKGGTEVSLMRTEENLNAVNACYMHQ